MSKCTRLIIIPNSHSQFTQLCCDKESGHQDYHECEWNGFHAIWRTNEVEEERQTNSHKGGSE